MMLHAKFKFLFLLALLFCQHKSVAQEAEAGSITVITYNIWNGFDWGKDSIRNDKTIAWIKEKNPDVLALQELCGYTEERLKKDAAQWGHNYYALLKTDGYPVGLTSKKPIVIKEKLRDELWHGMLHCETYGIDFYVVHLSPHDVDFRFKEVTIIAKKIAEDEAKDFMILGDFNSQSPFDGDQLLEKAFLLERNRTRKSDKGYSNLRLGNFDFSVMSRFLSLPSIDVTRQFVPAENRFSFPTPVLVGSFLTEEQVPLTRQRIDYILTSPELANYCTGAQILNGPETAGLSDHYPVIAHFQIPN